MSTKKKIIISAIAILIATIIAFSIGFFANKGNDNEKILEMKEVDTISYFANTTRTEGFSLNFPKHYTSKIFVSIDKPDDKIQAYKFQHISSGEVLFIVYISEKDAYKGKVTGEILGKTDNYTYLWSQSLYDNTYIKDESAKKEFNSIAKYYATIKSTVKIISNVQEVVTKGGNIS